MANNRFLGRGWLGLFVVLYLQAGLLTAQDAPRKYLVLLKDKAGSPYSLSNPSRFLSDRSVERRLRQNIALTDRDLPVNPAYVQSLRQTGARVWYTSRWLNAVLLEADEATLQSILRLPFVKGLEGNDAVATARREAGSRSTGGKSLPGGTLPGGTARLKKRDRYFPKDHDVKLQYGPSADQVAMIGADQMHQQGYHGEGMLIAVLDGGFRDVDRLPHFQSLITETRLVSTYDFVRNETSVFEDNSHGAQVLGTMAGYLEKKLIGTAYKAKYILLRTEDVSSEQRIEEVNWLIAAEYADSAGVDVINSSLGYSTFDNPDQNYRYADLNGQKALISRAADWAAARGIVVVNSAGNEGDNSWQYITPPADADSVLTVASVNKDRVRAASSSKGPTADRRVKPDLAALGQGAVVGTSATGIVTSSGTSFASPVLAGMVAGFWQAFPHLTNMQVVDILKRSASQYSHPDSLLGYGIPNFVKASELVALQKSESRNPFVFPNPFDSTTNPQIWLGNLPKGPVYTATLADATGKVIWTYTLDNELSPIPVRTLSLAPGLYFLKIISNTGAAYSVKMIRQ